MTIPELTQKVQRVADQYAKEFGVTYSDDWFLLKLQEELGEMTRAHLVRTERTRHKSASEEAAKEALAEEIADVFAYILIFARRTGIDIEDAVVQKWFKYLPK
jgi:NTP pyrophosphatase (non-canonical NTP hydrolase)